MSWPLAGEWYNPDNTIDLLGLLILGLPASLPAVAALIVVVRGQRRGRKRWASDRDTLRDVQDQVSVVAREVKNDHPDGSNLRDQLDRMDVRLDEAIALVRDIHEQQIGHGRDIRGIRTDVEELRGEARTLRADQRDHERRVQEAYRLAHPDLPPP